MSEVHEFIARHEKSKFIKMVIKWFSFKVDLWKRIAKSFLGGVLFIILCLKIWKRVTFLREPKWVRNIPEVAPTNLTSRIVGSVLNFVTTGNFCRTFMGPETPDYLRFSNGLGAGFIRDFILVKEPKLVKAVLSETNTAKPEKGYRGFQRLTGYKGTMDFLSTRSHTHPLYTSNKANVYKTLMRRTAATFQSVFIPTIESLIERLKQKEDVAIVNEMHLLATSIITKVAFDEHSSLFDKSLFESAIWIINDTLLRPQNNNFKFLDWIPTAWNSELKKRQNMLVNTIEAMIKRKKRQRKDGIKGDDVINVLLDNELNKDEDVLGILSIFFFAGFDTTSNTMSLILHNLANNRDAQEKCRDEIDDIIGLDEKPNMQNIQRLRYLKAVIFETLRLYPVVPMIAREVTETHFNSVCPRFQEKESFGIAINLFGLHYNEEGWKDPDCFVPERWLNSEFDADMNPAKRLFCPFALGKRACMGKQFATVEMLSVVAMIIQNFEVSQSDKSPELSIKEAGSLVVSQDYCLKFKEITSDFDLDSVDFQQKIYTLEEVAEHNDKASAWIVLNDNVYDITDFINRVENDHPGGPDILIAMAGSDATEDFEHQGHSKDAFELLKEFHIGIVKPYEPQPLPIIFRRSSATATLSNRSSLSTRSRSASVKISLNSIKRKGEERRRSAS